MSLVRNPRRLWALLTLLVTFLKALLVSAWQVARAVLSPTARLQPAIVAVPIALKTDLGIAILANMVTLTPGTTALHISENRETLYIHVLDSPSADAVIRNIKDTFESLIRRIEP